MEFSVTNPTTPALVKARLPLLQARRQLPFSGTSGTPKRKKPSSSHKKGAKSAGGSLAGDSTNSDEEQMATSKSGCKSIRDTLAVEVAALKEQLSKVQIELLNRQLETVQIVASVKSDLMQLHNQLQLYQEAHANLEGVVDRTTSRVSNNKASISDIHSKLSATDRKQEELRQALESLRAMPALTANTGLNNPPPAHNAAFFLGGIPQLRTTLEFRPQADPMEVVSTVLRDIQMYCAVDRIFLADTQATNRVGHESGGCLHAHSLPQARGYDQTQETSGPVEGAGGHSEGLLPYRQDGESKTPGQLRCPPAEDGGQCEEVSSNQQEW
jgi:hypothetical protein